MNYQHHAFCVKGGQGRDVTELLAYWPGIFKITTISLLIGCIVLAHYVIQRSYSSRNHVHHTVTIERVAP